MRYQIVVARNKPVHYIRRLGLFYPRWKYLRWDGVWAAWPDAGIQPYASLSEAKDQLSTFSSKVTAPSEPTKVVWRTHPPM
jgi:hypothetical protein